MKFFVASTTLSDTCGNSDLEHSDKWRYYRSESIFNVLSEEKYSINSIISYTLNNKKDNFGNNLTINKFRTPKGCGYGIWEANPEFLPLSSDKDSIIELTAGGFKGVVIREVYVQYC